jgi:hypothetical protein
VLHNQICLTVLTKGLIGNQYRNWLLTMLLEMLLLRGLLGFLDSFFSA